MTEHELKALLAVEEVARRLEEGDDREVVWGKPTGGSPGPRRGSICPYLGQHLT